MKSSTARTATPVTLLADVRVPQPGAEAGDRARQALRMAEARTITNDDDYKAGADELQAVKSKLSEIEGTRKALKAPVLEAGRRIEDFFRGPLDFLTRAESILKRKLYGYQQKVEQRRRDEQARADEEARRRRQALEEQAARAAAKGKNEKAEALQQQAQEVVPVAVQASAPKVAGISTRENWTFEVTDADKIPREYLTPDLVKIGKVVRALKGDTQIAGITVKNEGTLAASRG